MRFAHFFENLFECNQDFRTIEAYPTNGKALPDFFPKDMLTKKDFTILLYVQCTKKGTCIMQHIKTARIGLRATFQQQSLIRKAAEIRQQSITEFILQSACISAESTLLDQRIFFADDNAWKTFTDALESPPTYKPSLENLLTEKAPWEE